MNKRAKGNKHTKAKTKQIDKNLGFLGNSITHARIGLHAHNKASPCPENLKTQKIEHKQEKPNSNNLACSDPRQNYILT